MELTQKIKLLVSQPSLLISDDEYVIKKITSLCSSSPENIQIVADFDYTLTYCYDNGEKLWSSFGALERYPQLSDKFREKLIQLCSYYTPVDADPSIDKEKKSSLIMEWSKSAVELYISECIDVETIRNAVAVANVKFRNGFKELVDCLAASDIPLLILSAGLGNTIDHMLANSNISHDNVSVISNYLKFDENSRVNGMTKPLITTGTKGKVRTWHPKYFDSVCERKNAILLGDRIEDLHVASCFEDCENILTIGFLNENVECHKDLYKEKYDIVLLGDPDLSFVQKLLDIII